MTKDYLGEIISDSAMQFILDANKIMALVLNGEKISDFESAVEFVDIMAEKLKRLQTMLATWEKMENE